jgi:hypothetical protein
MLTIVAVVLIAFATPSAQGTGGQPQGEGRQGGGGGGGRGRGGVPPVPYDDYTGFTKLWDGTTLTNWDGETDVWSIQNGAIHADTTKTPGQHHIHYVGPGAIMRDFDLKVEMKMSATGANGGIQYRSRLLHGSRGGSIQDPLGRKLPAGITTMQQAVAAGVAAQPAARGGGAGGRAGGPGGAPGANPPGGAPAAAAGPPAVIGPCTPPPGAGRGAGCPGGGGGGGRADQPANAGNPWQVSGYQFDMNSANNYTGQLYEGQGRGIVTAPGTIVQLLPGNGRACLGTITESPAAAVKEHKGFDGEWNQIQIIARGTTLIHMINGKVITVTVDDDPERRAFQGILSLQLEGSGQIWYRNIYVRNLDAK